jgi:hypothetical protein
MQAHRHLLKSVLGKAVLATAVFGGFLLFGGVTGAEAQVRPVVRYDDARLARAVVNHGFYSPRASYWRYERHEAFLHGWRDRFGCWHRY